MSSLAMDYREKGYPPVLLTRHDLTNADGKRKRRGLCCVLFCNKRLVPWASLVAVLVTWAGLFLFCSKVYFGLLDMEEVAGGLFKFLIDYLRMVREGVVVMGVLVAGLTGSMVIIGFFATLQCEGSYHGRASTCLCMILGSRLLCGLFWFLGYLLNMCFLIILTALVLATSAYFCFLPICLPQGTLTDTFCFNFTLIASVIGGGGMNGPSSVSLILCGTPIDKFCKLTRSISTWYWGAYGGCLAVLVGLAHFNGTLAANFAHAKHAARYKKIRRRTKDTVKWTRDWRVKGITYTPSTNSSGISTVSGSVAIKESGFKPNDLFQDRRPSQSLTCEDDSPCYNDSDSGAFLLEQNTSEGSTDQSCPTRLIRTTSNGSIILHKRQSNERSGPNPRRSY